MGQVYTVTHSSRGQHTLRWMSPIVDADGTMLPPGTINLYQYPLVSFGEQLPVETTGRTFQAVRWLLHQVAAEPNRVFYRRDASGALPTHALAIANTDASLEMISELYARWPRMISLVHGPGLYQGEHALHIMAVNRREEELCKMLDIARLRLSHKGWLAFLAQKPDGIFFLGNPMSFYGSTLTSFAAAFGLQAV
eukprot:6218403-Prymnesium_polylepis.1